MKHCKILYLLTALVLLASCSADELLSLTSNGTVEASFEVQLPTDALATRSYSDGLTAHYLTYGVYRKTAGALELVESVERDNVFSGRTATVTLQLLKGEEYTIVFWADAGAACPYTIDLEAQTVTMDYSDTNTSIEANNEARDVFYNTVELSADEATLEHEVKLYRPLAQLNIGTRDLQDDIVRNNCAVANMKFEVSVPAGLPTVLSLIDGKASEPTTEAIVFHSTGTPSFTDGAFPVEGYEYVQMNYMLVGEGEDEGEIVTKQVCSEAVTFTASDAGLGYDVVCTAYNVPLQRNYRTNIYGNLLTDPATYEISIDQRYFDDIFIMDYEHIWYYAYCEPEMLIDGLQKGFNVALLCDMTLTEEMLAEYCGSSALTLNYVQGIDLNGYTLTIESSAKQDALGYQGDYTAYGSIVATQECWILNGNLVMDNSVYTSGTGGLRIKDVNITVGEETTSVSGAKAVTRATSTTEPARACVVVNSTCTDQSKEGWESAAVVENCTLKCYNTDPDCFGVYVNTDATVYVTDCDIVCEGQGVQNTTSSIGICVGNPSCQATVYVTNTNISNALTVAGDAYAILNRGTGTVYTTNCQSTCSSETGDPVAIYNYSTGKVVVQDMDAHINANGSSSIWAAIVNYAAGTIEATNVNIDAEIDNASYLIGIYCKVSSSSSRAPGGGGTTSGTTTTTSKSGRVTLTNCNINLAAPNSTSTLPCAVYHYNDTIEIINSTISVEGSSSSGGFGLYHLIDKPVTLTGSTIEVKNNGGAAQGVYNNTTGSISISDASIKATGTTATGLYNYTSGTIKASNCSVEATGTSGVAYGIRNYNTSATIACTDCDISATGTSGTYAFYGNNGTCTVSGGSLSASTTSSSAAYCISNCSSNLSVEGMTFRSNSTGTGATYGIYHSGSSYTLSVTDCTFDMNTSGSGALYPINSSGQATVSNCDISSTSTGTGAVYGVYVGSSSKTVISSVSDCKVRCSSYGNAIGIGQNATMLNISNCDVHATSNATSSSYYANGVRFNGNGALGTISNSDVSATGYIAYGLYKACGFAVASNSSFTANGTYNAAGVYNYVNYTPNYTSTSYNNSTYRGRLLLKDGCVLSATGGSNLCYDAYNYANTYDRYYGGFAYTADCKLNTKGYGVATTNGTKPTDLGDWTYTANVTYADGILTLVEFVEKSDEDVTVSTGDSQVYTPVTAYGKLLGE